MAAAGTSKSTLTAMIDLLTGARHLASVNFPFDPVPASRPRVTRWGVYYSKTYSSWKKLAEENTASGPLELAATTPLVVIVESVCKKAKSSKLAFPKGDTDNYAKGPLDVITKAEGYWCDDKQVVWLLSGKRFAAPGEDPHTAVHIYQP